MSDRIPLSERILPTMVGATTWVTISFWLIADRALHGGVNDQHLIAAVLLVVLGSALSFATSDRREPSRAAHGAAKVGVPIVTAITFCSMVVVATTIEIAFRSRPDDSLTTLLASFLVHACAAAIFAVCLSAGFSIECSSHSRSHEFR